VGACADHHLPTDPFQELSMASNTLRDQHLFPVADRLSGTWKLMPEQAVTLNPGHAGVLRVTEGRVWATLEGPHHGPANDWGDKVLRCGQQICLLPGQQVVVEAFVTAANDGAAHFSREPACADRPAAIVVPPVAPRPWLTGLPGRVARVATWLRGALSWLVAGRGRVLSPLESNQP